MAQGVSTSQQYDLSKWSCRPAALHRKHGKNIQLSENDSVAKRVRSFDLGMVFTAEPVPVGDVLQVTLLVEEKPREWSGTFSMGFTVLDPAECTIPDDANKFLDSSSHWTLWGALDNRPYQFPNITNRRSTVMCHDQKHAAKGLPSFFSLKPGESAAIGVDNKGDLHYLHKGKHVGVVWSGLPTDKPLWGFGDLYGMAKKVKVEIFASDELSPKTTELTQQLSQQREGLTRTREQLVQQEQLAQRRQQEVQQLQGRLDTAQAEMQQLRSQSQQAQQLAQRRQQEVQQLREELTQQQQLVQRRQQDVQQLQGRLDTAQAEMQQLRSQPQHAGTQEAEFWQVPREDVQVFEDRILGRGGWGYVAEGKFRGQRVAIKRVYPDILRPLTLDRIRREVSTMAQVRHPNLVLFIASVLDDQDGPMIITEILDLSLRRAYEEKRLGSNKLCIFRDVAAALNYLHKHREPIIHRDVSTANVLLEAMANSVWKAKISDFGSANLVRLATTLGEGAIVYTAPEAFPQPPNSPLPRLPQTSKIDVYSYGVLLCEVVTCQFPNPDNFQSMVEEVHRQWPLMHTLIRDSTKYNPDERPTMAYILEQLERPIRIPR